ncbi:T9SS type A sorting domain-containing protein [Flavobacterium sp. SUN046]|uniref:T9SS type A sorting domain-containing protein n=1 Tax=Flavobacterium sp. SUN046 TaxID=3002440 RepID=UPI002DB9E711|nr:T9SS type A sorting domain-containing protein [Flavobacterium sp. SUN046]MEC4047962.1 T9SS type A sorting domain-containing protein [Flavobacterium sp. SUN046]
MKKSFLIFIFLLSFSVFSQVLDPTFGTNGGIVTKQVSNTPPTIYANAAVIQSDGKMIYAGGNYISRTTVLGSIDTSFNSYGFRTLSSGLEALCLQVDGKILVAGFDKIYRINTDGSLDTNFGTNGMIQIIQNGSSMFIKSIGIKTNGQIIIAGYISNGTNNDFAVVSLNSNGSYNTFFNFDGISTLDVSNSNDEAFAMKIQSDGKIVLCGQSYDTTLGIYHFTTARFNSVGELDTTFGTLGYVITKLPTSYTIPTSIESRAKSLDIQSDGKIVISGFKKGNSLTSGYLTVVRYTTTGNLDLTFGTGGIVLTTKSYIISSITTTRYLIKPQIIVQEDGKILISGNLGNGLGLYKFESNGIFDTTFGTGGVVVYNDPGTLRSSTFLLINPNNEIITGGTVYSPNGILTFKSSNSGTLLTEQNFNLFQGKDTLDSLLEGPDGKIIVTSSDNNVLLKYNTDGLLDTSFGTDGILVLSSDYLCTTTQQDGKILYSTGQAISRLNMDGTVDTTFGNNGIVDFEWNSPLIVDFIDKILVASDSKIYICFDYNSPTSSQVYDYTYYGVLRLNNDGSIDTTFGDNGYVGINFDYYAENELEWPHDIFEQADGKLIITGQLLLQNSPINLFGGVGTVRLNNDGQIDSSFGINGKVITLGGGINEGGLFITKTLDNKYLLNISSNNLNGLGLITELIRMNYDGSTDTFFGVNGILADANMYDVLLQPDGKILRAGSVNNQFGIYRNNSDGSIDSSFGANGLISNPINYFSHINKIAILQNNKLLAGGYTYNGDSQILALARYTDLNLGELEFTKNENNFIVYPNPIEEQAVFSYILKEATEVTIELIDLQGKVVQLLIKGKNQKAGENLQVIQLPNYLTSGNYILRFSSPVGNQSIKIIKK